MRLTFDEFSNVNARRCEEDFGRKVAPETVPIHVLAACGEVGEMAQDMKRILDRQRDSDPEFSVAEQQKRIKDLLFEAADAFTYLDLIASHYGYRFSEILVEKFNIVSERVGSKAIITE